MGRFHQLMEVRFPFCCHRFHIFAFSFPFVANAILSLIVGFFGPTPVLFTSLLAT